VTVPQLPEVHLPKVELNGEKATVEIPRVG
jgi:hypothetical protein